MKIITIVSVGLLTCLPVCGFGAITLTISTGQLLESDGVTALSDGALLQVVADTDGTGFSAPSDSAFVTGTNFLVAEFSLNSATFGVPGSTIATLSGLTFAGGWGEDDDLLFRWFPTLTTSSISPGAGTSYGEFRTDSPQDGATIGWITPADGATESINFVTTSAFGSNPPSTAVANLSTVPEPSAGLLVLLSAGLLGISRRRR